MVQQPRLLADGLQFGEGPRWRQGRLWFSDFYAHRVYSISLAGDLRTELEIDDQPSGLGWMPDGSLLVVSMIRRQVLRRWPDGEVRLHADLGNLASFHCNDMVVDSHGRAYVGNFGFDLDAEMAARGVAEVFANHTAANLARIDPDGSVHLAATDLHFPTGPVITPDGRTLIIAETLAAQLTAFDIAPDGGLSNRRIWAPTSPRLPDGIALDADGAVWIANAAAPECVRIRQGGEVLEVVATGHPCFACALGGEDGRTLFMLTAEAMDSDNGDTLRKGQLLATTVSSPRAGTP